MADGADGAEHALHRRCHGRLGGELSSAGVNSSASGDFDFVPSCDSLCESQAECAATVSADDVGARASGGDGVGNDALCIAVCTARGWMGDAIGGGLSNCALWLAALATILPHSLTLYAFLRKAHAVLAYLLFLMFIAHLGAILFHTLIVRDGILLRMAPWNIRARE